LLSYDDKVYNQGRRIYPFTEADDRPHGATKCTAATQATTDEPLHVEWQRLP